VGTAKPNIIYRILNIWVLFISLLLILSYFPHWENVTFHSLIFLLFLLSIYIFHNDNNNQDIFFNLSILFLAYSFSFVNVYIGKNCLFGNDTIKYYFYLYKQLVFSFLFNFVIIYIVLKNIFSTSNKHAIYLITMLIILPAFLFNFSNYILNPKNIFMYGNGNKFLADLFQRMFLFHVLAFIFIIIYGCYLFKKDCILGRYVNSLMAFFFIYSIIEMIDKLSYVYDFQIFSMSQYILTFNLLFLASILFRKLLYTYSEYGQFYESMITQNGRLGKMQIQQHGAEKHFLVLRFLKLYVSKRRNYLLTLAILTGMGIAYFQFPKFFTINILAFAGSGVLLFAFVGALYRKRSVKNFLIS